MIGRTVKRRRTEIYRQHLDLRVAFSILSVFSLMVAMYLVANCARLVGSLAVSIEPEAAVTVRGGQTAASVYESDFSFFESQDDFKSYIDDGQRLYGDGLLEEKTISPLLEAGKIAVSSAKVAGGVQAKAEPVAPELNPEVFKKYYSLNGIFNPEIPDIVQAGAGKIYYSAENQYYSEGIAGLETDAVMGQTLVVNVSPAESLAQSETIPADGKIVLADGVLMVFSGNTLVAYNSDSVFGRQELWRDRFNEGSRIISSKLMGQQLYLALSTKIDMASPCPIKPVAAGSEQFLVRCSDIYHPKKPMLADSIVTLVQIGVASGQISKSISFVAMDEGAAVNFTEDAIYAAWSQGGDYVSYFSEFANEKCKSLLPNYILDKSAKLRDYNISLLAKELELRTMMSNWLATLSELERERIVGEISKRLADYLEGNYMAYEQTRLEKIDVESFKFADSTSIPGLIPDPGFADIFNGQLRVLTVSGKGVYEKMNWLASGQLPEGKADIASNNIYVFDSALELAGSAENLGIPHAVCVVRFAGDIAYASACDGDSIYLINLSVAENLGLASNLSAASNDYFIYPIEGRRLMVISKSKRNVSLVLYDNFLAAKPQKISEYALSDYWADFDSNFRGFGADDGNKLFFVPAGKGGYVFFYGGGSIELQKKVGEHGVVRAFFEDGSLYLISGAGVEIFGAPEWSAINSVEFNNK